MMQSRDPIVIEDSRNNARDAELMGSLEVETGFRSKAGVPIIFNAESVGEIDIKSLQPGSYTTRDVDLLEQVASLIAGAVANARLHSTVTTRAEEELVMSAIGRLVSASLDFGSTFDQFAALVKQLIPYDRFVVAGLDVEAQLSWTHFVAGMDIPGWGPGTSRVVTGWRMGQHPLSPEGMLFDADPGQGLDEDPAIKSVLPALAFVPLIWEDRSVGNISIRATEAGRFTEHHLVLLGRVASQIVGAFVNAELHAITARDATERSFLAEIGRLWLHLWISGRCLRVSPNPSMNMFPTIVYPSRRTTRRPKCGPRVSPRVRPLKDMKPAINTLMSCRQHVGRWIGRSLS
jgi:GAF domain-containing protein